MEVSEREQTSCDFTFTERSDWTEPKFGDGEDDDDDDDNSSSSSRNGNDNGGSDSPALKRRKMSEEVESSGAICQICRQNVSDPGTKSFQGLADGALEEEAALTDDRLQLYSAGSLMPEIDIKPLHKVTQFTVFDGEGHLCPFDTGLIESDALLFFSGYIKPVYEEDPSPENGVPAQELGPIVEWWISGFDGGNSFLIAFRSPYAEYILMEPSPDYASFMRLPKQKALLTKIVVEFLGTASKPSLDDLLSRISEVSVPGDIEPFDSDSLRKHAQFIIDQVQEVDADRRLMSTPAVQDIVKRFGVVVRGSLSDRKRSGPFKRWGKVTTTLLVRKHFKFFLDGEDCPEDCPRKCPAGLSPTSPTPKTLSKFTWEENSDFALVNGQTVRLGDFVHIQTNQPDKEGRVFRIERFFQQNFTKQIHCSEFVGPADTILGHAGDSSELFYVNECSEWPICKIVRRVNVVVRELPRAWTDFLTYRPGPVPPDTLFVQKRYSRAHGSFEDFRETTITGTGCCVCREKSRAESTRSVVTVGDAPDEVTGVTCHEKVIRGKEEYVTGCCVFLEPFSVVFDAQRSSLRIEKALVTRKADEVIYPEIYRKAKETNLIEDCAQPFVVAHVRKMFTRVEGSQKKLFFAVNKFYRPEDTRMLDVGDERLLDLQLLFWSEETVEVSFDHVQGRCDVVRSEVPPESLGLDLSPRFYFHSGFDADRETFYDASHITVLGREEKSEPGGDRLRTLSAFSGCGGLAEGLSQSGAANIMWSVEIDKGTSEAFKMNFPNVTTFETDCNLFLRAVMSGKSTDVAGCRYPGRGDVELLCGGPPCQGFSTMNRFTAKEESRYNNSLILTFLSFCDFYRPRFFLMENVRNFASYKKSEFLKHALGSLVAMGYQCSFGVLQAGNYGLPQSRRRLFIVGAAPGYRLPVFPKPTHVFYGALRSIECEISGTNFSCRFSKPISDSAPFRNVTIRDAICDLSQVPNGTPLPADGTYYRRFTMSACSLVQDHVTKDVSPINEARIRYIPAAKGCDWRDLPNIPVRLRDGTLTEVLKYLYHDRKNGKSCCGLFRGVCGCASGKACDPGNRQNNTLIPWFLVHTANRNNNWTGLYGRLDWDGVFNTVTTNPEPSNQQGKVLHPRENRIVTVRECARAQGLPDSFKLTGTVMDRFKQVGNAVPPPISRAIGREIRRCYTSGCENS